MLLLLRRGLVFFQPQLNLLTDSGWLKTTPGRTVKAGST